MSTLSTINDNTNTSEDDVQLLKTLLERGENLSLDIPQLDDIRNVCILYVRTCTKSTIMYS